MEIISTWAILLSIFLSSYFCYPFSYIFFWEFWFSGSHEVKFWFWLIRILLDPITPWFTSYVFGLEELRACFGWAFLPDPYGALTSFYWISFGSMCWDSAVTAGETHSVWPILSSSFEACNSLGFYCWSIKLGSLSF